MAHSSGYSSVRTASLWLFDRQTTSEVVNCIHSMSLFCIVAGGNSLAMQWLPRWSYLSVRPAARQGLIHFLTNIELKPLPSLSSFHHPPYLRVRRPPGSRPSIPIFCLPAPKTFVRPPTIAEALAQFEPCERELKLYAQILLQYMPHQQMRRVEGVIDELCEPYSLL